MSRTEQVEQLTTLYGALSLPISVRVLPDDIIAKLDELAEKEDSPLSKVIYQTMKRNQDLAVRIKPSFLSGYRCASVLGKMRNQLPADR